MKISIYKLPDGTLDAMVEAAHGHGKSPVVLKGVTTDNVRERLAPVLAAQKGRRMPPPMPEPS